MVQSHLKPPDLPEREYVIRQLDKIIEKLTELNSKLEDNLPLEQALEQAYWEFDAIRKGYGKYKLDRPSERDAFKITIRGLLNE